MAEYVTTDTELTSVANAIRTKGGTSASLAYPTGFVSAIQALPEIQSSKSVTPTESAQTVSPDSGYGGIAQVNVGAISNTYVGTLVTRKAAQTYTPGTSDQTISANQYLTGAQTIKGDANLVAANIAKDVTIFGVTGTHEGGGGGGSTITFTVNYGSNRVELFAAEEGMTFEDLINDTVGYNKAGRFYKEETPMGIDIVVEYIKGNRVVSHAIQNVTTDTVIEDGATYI